VLQELCCKRAAQQGFNSVNKDVPHPVVSVLRSIFLDGWVEQRVQSSNAGLHCLILRPQLLPQQMCINSDGTSLAQQSENLILSRATAVALVALGIHEFSEKRCLT
ncbi:MAG TPA: hypothetical protein VHV32_03825, partial [Candidatus Angelobacter sp.]|nr:hypothetical protein [Candidatus Angelobacter sp.]